MLDSDRALAAIDAWAEATIRDAEAGLIAFAQAFTKRVPPETSATEEET